MDPRFISTHASHITTAEGGDYCKLFPGSQSYCTEVTHSLTVYTNFRKSGITFVDASSSV